jgi:hypothetical protein
MLNKFKTLQVVDLSYNTLTGMIPAQVSSLSGLTTLDLGNNKLMGTIPAQLSSLSALDVLVLGNNKLTGTIPAQLSSLSGLTALDLSYNSLLGPIPSSMSSLTALQVLLLNNNAIVGGTIPAGVPSVGFPQGGDCEMGGQCSACSYVACCSGRYEQYDPTCTPGYYGNGYKRLETPMCRACGFYETGTCSTSQSNTCANVTRAEGTCGASCS